MIDLSVLICSTHTRYATFGQAIQRQIWQQFEDLSDADRERIEIIMLTDNKAMMLGAKRNVMVDMAQGRYVVFVDDDDRIEPNYLATLLNATQTGVDVITFLVAVSINGGPAKPCRYSKDYAIDRNTPDRYERLPNHICCIRKEVAARVSFPNVLYGEDSAYSKLLVPHLKSEYHINRVLYHYDYDQATTETQLHRRAALRRRPQPPLVDVVMLSWAKNPQMARMTQRAVDTCIAGANSLPVNVVVVEQNEDVTYLRANTVHMPGEFNYNRFANKGAQFGSADWIMVANNDLIYHDGWLHRLLAANHPIVSPKCPRDRRQRDIEENTSGYTLVRNLSGWCYMIKRELWELIGHLDERVRFWCSDDVLIEQLIEAGVPPMLVADSHVEHLMSVTLKDDDDPDDLMWRQVEIFNHAYGADKFANDPRYETWKRIKETQ